MTNIQAHGPGGTKVGGGGGGAGGAGGKTGGGNKKKAELDDSLQEKVI